jgi:hypothetical protein
MADRLRANLDMKSVACKWHIGSMFPCAAKTMTVYLPHPTVCLGDSLYNAPLLLCDSHSLRTEYGC